MPQNGLSIDEKASSAGVNSAGQPLWQCRKCDEGPFVRKKLRTHYFKHDRLPCDYCTHSALNPRDLRIHVDTWHQPFSSREPSLGNCRGCLFAWSMSLERHIANCPRPGGEDTLPIAGWDWSYDKNRCVRITTGDGSGQDAADDRSLLDPQPIPSNESVSSSNAGRKPHRSRAPSQMRSSPYASSQSRRAKLSSLQTPSAEASSSNAGQAIFTSPNHPVPAPGQSSQAYPPDDSTVNPSVLSDSYSHLPSSQRSLDKVRVSLTPRQPLRYTDLLL